METERVHLPFKMDQEGMDRFARRLLRTKTILSQTSVDEETADDNSDPSSMKKVLTTFDLTSLGVGSCCGTGMYVVAGLVARNVAGPSAIFSFLVAAIASILSGVCYAEFGVRVPKTSGSAYMYSYVTVGEFVAFLIGWNLILEYMIGSAAGASALSACFDALGNHSMSAYLESHVGQIIGKTYPDFLGCGIALVMTVILSVGVQKSVRFNSILNGVNFLVWIFIFIAGLCFVRSSNWTEVNFAPYGISGVFSGAATCFYAFIGFDIIATTGEEAKNPSRSIPIAIILSLIICLTAYISITCILTLMVPYYDIEGDSALIDMFVQRDFGGAKYVVAVGSVCALTVSLLGSMFPMPRVIYAMSRDGLLFKFLGDIHPKFGTPVIATVVTGIMASLMSLLVSLQILVEMMSIGTLLAYSLVAVSVMILRYQPSKHGREPAIPLGHKLDPIEESPDGPPSDDVFEEIEEPKMRFKDDEQLITPTSDQKSYGSFQLFGLGLESKMAYVKRHLKIGWMKLGFPSDDVIPNETTAKNVIIFVGVMAMSEFSSCMMLVFAIDAIARGEFWALVLLVVFLGGIVTSLVFILRQPQNKKKLKFMAPGVPFVPCFATFFNMYLILKLPAVTWVRLVVWICLGLLLYFSYSMFHSAKEKKMKLQELEQQKEKDLDKQIQLAEKTTAEQTQLNSDGKLCSTDGIPNGEIALSPKGNPGSGCNKPVERLACDLPNRPALPTKRGEGFVPNPASEGGPKPRIERVRFGDPNPALTNPDANANRENIQRSHNLPQSSRSQDETIPTRHSEHQVSNKRPNEIEAAPASGQPYKRTNQIGNNTAAVYGGKIPEDERDPYAAEEKDGPRTHKENNPYARPRPRPRVPLVKQNPFGNPTPDGGPGEFENNPSKQNPFKLPEPW